MKIRPEGSRFHADGQTDRLTRETNSSFFEILRTRLKMEEELVNCKQQRRLQPTVPALNKKRLQHGSFMIGDSV
jgi:hypothetical protein